MKITSDLTFDDTKAREVFGWNPTPVLEGFKLNPYAQQTFRPISFTNPITIISTGGYFYFYRRWHAYIF